MDAVVRPDGLRRAKALLHVTVITIIEERIWRFDMRRFCPAARAADSDVAVAAAALRPEGAGAEILGADGALYAAFAVVGVVVAGIAAALLVCIVSWLIIILKLRMQRL